MSHNLAQSHPRPGDRLARLVGTARARVLRGLAHPDATTTGLAAVLGYAPSSVSAQLSVLVDSGVATRRRVGRKVVYGLTPAGRAVLAWLDDPVHGQPERAWPRNAGVPADRPGWARPASPNCAGGHGPRYT